MASKMVIVKRRGHREPYDERKVYGSVYAACLAARESEISAAVAKEITLFVKEWRVVTSDQIFREVILKLGRHSHKAVFLYENHRDLL